MNDMVLTLPERNELTRHEITIERGLKVFQEVGAALLAIRDQRLYREHYGTFEEYCRERWGISRVRAYQIMDAAGVVENVKNFIHPPTVESHAKPLAKLEPDTQRQAWQEAVETAPNGKVTGAHVQNVVDRYTSTSMDNGYKSEPILVARSPKEILEAAKEIRKQQREERIEEKVQVATSLPNDIYNVIYADPPWQYNNTGVHGAANHHYPTMPLMDICGLPEKIGLQVASNAVLFLWVTSPFLRDAFQVIDAWGFEYKTNMVWVKTDLQKPGSGFYVRGRHEFLFICTRGNFTPLNPNIAPPIGSVLEAPVQEHSRKPTEFYNVIERLYPNCNCIELFARYQRDGWKAWGNQIDVFCNQKSK